MNYLLHSHLKPGIAYRRKANVTKGQHAGEKRQAVSGMCYLNHADHLDKRRALNMTAEQTNKAFFSGCQSRLRQLGLGAAPGKRMRLRSGLRCFGLLARSRLRARRRASARRAATGPTGKEREPARTTRPRPHRTATRPAPELVTRPSCGFKYCLAFVTI